MQKPNLIIYESQMKSILKQCLKSKEPSTAEQMIMAMFNYYLDGEVYEGENEVVDMFMDGVYPLIDKQQENFIKKVESVISNEDFTALALSGNFSTQKELAEYITAHYGAYTQSAVSKRLGTLGITLVKTPKSNPQPSSSVSSAVEDKVLKTYKAYIKGWALEDSDAKQKIMDEYHISSAELERILGESATAVNTKPKENKISKYF